MACILICPGEKLKCSRKLLISDFGCCKLCWKNEAYADHPEQQSRISLIEMV